MKDLFVPYELAVKLKEKGFNQPCIGYYSNGVFYLDIDYNPTKNSTLNVMSQIRDENLISAPLWQQVADWLREEKGIHIEMHIVGCWKAFLVNATTEEVLVVVDDESYYSALQSGIDKAIELI